MGVFLLLSAFSSFLWQLHYFFGSRSSTRRPFGSFTFLSSPSKTCPQNQFTSAQPRQPKAEIVVSLEVPHLVIRSNSGIRGLLDYNESEILGRSIKILLGPQTDSIVIHSSIKSSSFLKSTVAHVVLYGKMGQCRNVIVSCSPFHDEGGSLTGCLMLLENSEAVTLKQALEGSSCAKALISAEYPHMVQMVNDEFTCEFGFTQSQVMGRSLRTIHGPRTDSEVWRTLLQTATTGRISRATMYQCSSSCSESLHRLTCVPVAEADGAISNLLIFFESANESTAAVTNLEPASYASGRNAAASARFDFGAHLHALRECAAAAPPPPPAASVPSPSFSPSLLDFGRFSPLPPLDARASGAGGGAPRRRTEFDLSELGRSDTSAGHFSPGPFRCGPADPAGEPPESGRLGSGHPSHGVRVSRSLSISLSLSLSFSPSLSAVLNSDEPPPRLGGRGPSSRLLITSLAGDVMIGGVLWARTRPPRM